MTRDEIYLYDLKQSCFHEAGHAVALLAFGAKVSVCICPNETPADPDNEKLTIGRCESRGRISAEQRPIVGLAGYVGELLGKGQNPEPIEILDILDSDPAVISGTDRLAIGNTDQTALYAAIVDTIGVLKRHQRFHSQLAGDLFETARDASDGCVIVDLDGLPDLQ